MIVAQFIKDYSVLVRIVREFPVRAEPGTDPGKFVFNSRLFQDFPFGLSLEPLQAYFAPYLIIASPPVSSVW